jgi:hypothetical protein
LRDVTWRFQQLQAQYDHLIAKSTTHNESSKKLESELEVCNFNLQEIIMKYEMIVY